MLTQQEITNCKSMLQNLSETDIFSLCETVTNRLVAPVSTAEAIDAIVRYSKSAQELLGRKKVKTEILFKYLQSVRVDVSPKSSKTELVSQTLDLWKGSSFPVSYNSVKADSPPIQVFSTQVNNYTMIQMKENDSQKIALEFIGWFYPMLCSLHETYPGSWGPQHFWPDAQLIFKAMTQSDEILQETYEGAEAVSQKLATFIRQEKVSLNPNNTVEGYRGIISPHGLAKVAVCGTLHKFDSGTSQEIVGAFEQCFGLLRDLNDGNRWKIKNCQLQIRVAGTHWHPNHVSLSEETVKSLEM